MRTNALLALGLTTIFVASMAHAAPIRVQGQEFMPYNGTENGKLGGAFTKIVELVCKKAALECVYEVVPLNRSLEQLKNGEAGITLGISVNDDRKTFATFPDPIASTGYTLFVKKGTAGQFKSLQDFKGKTIAVYGPSATQASAEKVHKENGEIYKLEKESTAPDVPFKKLVGGRYPDGSGVYSARSVGLYYAKTQKMDMEPVAFDAVKTSHAFGISKKGVDEATTKKILTTLAEVLKTPEAKKILADNDLQGIEPK